MKAKERLIREAATNPADDGEEWRDRLDAWLDLIYWRGEEGGLKIIGLSIRNAPNWSPP